MANNHEAAIAKMEQDLLASPPGGWVIRKEAADILGVDARTFRRWEKIGTTPFGAFPFRQHRYFRRIDIEALAAERKNVKAKRLAERSGPSRLIRIPIMTKKEQD